MAASQPMVMAAPQPLVMVAPFVDPAVLLQLFLSLGRRGPAAFCDFSGLQLL